MEFVPDSEIIDDSEASDAFWRWVATIVVICVFEIPPVFGVLAFYRYVQTHIRRSFTAANKETQRKVHLKRHRAFVTGFIVYVTCACIFVALVYYGTEGTATAVSLDNTFRFYDLILFTICATYLLYSGLLIVAFLTLTE